MIELHTRHSHCSYCGTPFDPAQPWPRTCAHCGSTTYLNPIPVAIVLIPVEVGMQASKSVPGVLAPDFVPGVLAVRRAISPGLGKLALPGGFIDLGERWQEAAAREVLEETGLVLDPQEVSILRVESAPDGTLILVAQAHPRSLQDLPPFTPNSECSERVVLTAPQEMAFPLHEQVVRASLEGPQAPSTG
jgi:ADP-ribose pyrophosphatase YjhB (NUDIX family)